MTGRRHSYSVTYKLEAIELAKTKSNRFAAKQLNIDESMIRRWRQQENDFTEMPVVTRTVSKRTKVGRGSEKMKEELKKWADKRRKGLQETGKPPQVASQAAIKKDLFSISHNIKTNVVGSNIKLSNISHKKVCALEISETCEYEAIGMNVGKKLEKMENSQAIYAETLINVILSKGLLNQLTSATIVCENAQNETVPSFNYYYSSTPSISDLNVPKDICETSECTDNHRVYIKEEYASSDEEKDRNLQVCMKNETEKQPRIATSSAATNKDLFPTSSDIETIAVQSNLGLSNTLHRKVCALDKSETSEYEAVGINVWKKLEKMENFQAIYAEILIKIILSKGLLNQLTSASIVCENASSLSKYYSSTASVSDLNVPKDMCENTDNFDDHRVYIKDEYASSDEDKDCYLEVCMENVDQETEDDTIRKKTRFS